MTNVIKATIANPAHGVDSLPHIIRQLERELLNAGVGEEKIDPANAVLFAEYIGAEGEFLNRDGKVYVSLDSIGTSIGKLFKHDVSRITDGSHTFDELYDHRCTLFLCLTSAVAGGISDNNFGIKSIWHSILHDDGTAFEGYTVVGIETSYGQCSYHVKDTPYGNFLRKNFQLYELERAPAWDGYTPHDVLIRLATAFLGESLFGAEKKQPMPLEL